jgi:hypothetical protein
VGLLLVFVTIQVGVVLPAAAKSLLGDGSGLATPAMVGGFLATWTMFIAALRVREAFAQLLRPTATSWPRWATAGDRDRAIENRVPFPHARRRCECLK